MTSDTLARALIVELLASPEEFDQSGRACRLLDAYTHGVSLETLRPLLRSENVFVQRSAAFVAAELGSDARPLLQDIVPLVRSLDVHVSCYAMEAVAVCARGSDSKELLHVARSVGSSEPAVKALAMRLLSRVESSDLTRASNEAVDSGLTDAPNHLRGLTALAAGDAVQHDTVFSMLEDADPIVRRYGAIAVRRLRAKCPALANRASSSDDEDVRRLMSE